MRRISCMLLRLRVLYPGYYRRRRYYHLHHINHPPYIYLARCSAQSIIALTPEPCLTVHPPMKTSTQSWQPRFSIRSFCSDYQGLNSARVRVDRERILMREEPRLGESMADRDVRDPYLSSRSLSPSRFS
jgi:hypothetical protein